MIGHTTSLTFVCALLGVMSCAHAQDAAPRPLKIVCIGDSITRGVVKGVTEEQTFRALLAKGLHERGIDATVIDAGVGDDNTDRGIKRFDKDVLAHKPDLVVIDFGVNDCWIDRGRTEPRVALPRYTDNLRQMIKTLKDRGTRVVMMTPTPMVPPTYTPGDNVLLRPYVATVRHLAKEYELPLVDLYRGFAELELEGTTFHSLTTDDCHPNPAGHELIAKWLLELEGVWETR